MIVSGFRWGKNLSLLKAILLLGGLILFSGCDRAGNVEVAIKEVNSLLAARSQAIEAKDLVRYKSLIYEGYAENGVSYDDVVNDIERLFAKEGDIEYNYQKARPSITMNSSRVVHMIEYKFLATGESARVREKLYLRKVDGTWFISGGVTLGLAP